MRDSFIEWLTKKAEFDKNIVLITGDLGFGVLDNFSKLYPKQFINAGVAEQNMTGMACGLAMQGFKVYTYSIGNFPTLRCLEQIRNDVCYHNADVTVVSVGGGFSYGQLGVSHFATEDLAIMNALPNIEVICPASKAQIESLLDEMDKIARPKYLRLDKDSADDIIFPNSSLDKPIRVRDGDAISILSTGPIIKEADKAAKSLAKEGIECRIISVQSLSSIDIKEIKLACEETEGIVTLEEHVSSGGLGSIVADLCLSNKINPKNFLKISIPNEYPSEVGDQNHLRHFYELDASSIHSKIYNLLRK